MQRYPNKIVVLAGIENELTAALGEAFKAEGALLARIDPALSEPREVAAAVLGAAREHGRLDVLLTNYLLPMPHEAALPATETGPEIWEAQQRQFFTLPALAATAAGRVMLAQGYGSVVHLGPVHGLFTQAQRAAYSAAAAGLFMHTKALAVEWGAWNVRVNAIACGVLPAQRGVLEPVSDETLRSRIPMGRRAEYREVCEAALFLAGDEASFVTGEVLRVDGGWTAYHLFYPFETAF